MRNHLLSVAALLASLLAGCARLPADGPQAAGLAPRLAAPGGEAAAAPAAGSDEAAVVLEALALVDRVSRLSDEQQRRALETAQQAWRREPGPESRLRLALLLSLPQPPFDDEARAAGLLAPLLDGADSPIRRLAAFVAAQLADRQRERKRADQLAAQLKELKAIERALIEREEPRR